MVLALSEARRYALVRVGVAFAALPAIAARAEVTATVTIRPGPLTLEEAPAGVQRLERARRGGYFEVLPPLRVVDTTGSGRGWRLTVRGAAVSIGRESYNGPAVLAPRAGAGAGADAAYASRSHGMGTTVLWLAVSARTPRLSLRFLLTQGPP